MIKIILIYVIIKLWNLPNIAITMAVTFLVQLYMFYKVF